MANVQKYDLSLVPFLIFHMEQMILIVSWSTQNYESLGRPEGV